MSNNTVRTVELNLFGVAGDTQLATRTIAPSVSIKICEKGRPDSSGRKLYKENSICAFLSGELPDNYEARVDQLITGLGGDERVGRLIQALQPKDQWIRLVVPCRSLDLCEDGAFSSQFLLRLTNMGLGLEIWHA